MIVIFLLLRNYILGKKNINLLQTKKIILNEKKVSALDFINFIKNKKIQKVFIVNNYKKIIFIKKNFNNNNIIMDDYYFTNIEPILLNKIINECIKNNIDFNFAKIIKNNVLEKITTDINFLFNNILLKFIYFIILLYLCNMIYNSFDFLYESYINNNNLFGNNYMINKNVQNNRNNNLTIQAYKKMSNDNNNFNIIKENISLSSWVGSPEVFEECFEVISYVKNMSNYKRFGVELPKGILLEGPPGVGKTLLAKAIASETESTFISVAGSEFVEIYVGVGASRVRNLFNVARMNSPSIIFIDEIDAIGKRRHGGGGGGSDERDQTLNQLLSEMDGFKNNDGIIILAATNRKEILDKALLRPGRFDRIIKIGYPDKYSREKIIKLYLDKKKYISKNINSSIIADLTDGFSGAELKNLINEAAILAARRAATKIMNKDILDAIEKNVVGLIKNIDTRNPETKFRISIHEVGHAFLVLYYSDFFDLVKISIKSTYNGAGGYTLFNEKIQYKNDGLYTKELLEKRLIISMGGKAAESIWYGDNKVSIGATQDLKQANQLARKMVGLFGMGDDLEVFYNQDIDGEYDLYGTHSNKYSEKIKEKFDIETLNLVSKSYILAKNILRENFDTIKNISLLLFDKENLEKNDIKYINIQNKL